MRIASSCSTPEAWSEMARRPFERRLAAPARPCELVLRLTRAIAGRYPDGGRDGVALRHFAVPGHTVTWLPTARASGGGGLINERLQDDLPNTVQSRP